MKLEIAKKQDKKAVNLVAFIGQSITGFETTLSINEKKYNLKLESSQIEQNSPESKS
jgi:hypothetical protein